MNIYILKKKKAKQRKVEDVYVAKCEEKSPCVNRADFKLLKQLAIWWQRTRTKDLYPKDIQYEAKAIFINWHLREFSCHTSKVEWGAQMDILIHGSWRYKVVQKTKHWWIRRKDGKILGRKKKMICSRRERDREKILKKERF